jgi:uncharacterized protein YigE (DUF2233 family)
MFRLARVPLLLWLLMASCSRPREQRAPSDRPNTFAVGSVRLRVVDLHRTRPLSEGLASDAPNAYVAINGGFFDSRGEPLGLLVSNGKTLSALDRELSGGVLWIRDGVAHLDAAEDYEERAVDFAIQCRPRLVVEGSANIQSDDGRRAARTAICLRDKGRELELISRPAGPGEGPTLFELARELEEQGCEEALNLDGGPSAGWVEPPGPGATVREPRAAIRHAIVVEPIVAKP